MNKQDISDLRSLKLHKAIAQKLRANNKLWDIPLINIEKWKDNNSNLPFVLAEWKHLLLYRPKEEIFQILEGSSQRAKQLRSSSPFTGILNDNERMDIFNISNY
jgi:hypothetical protein